MHEEHEMHRFEDDGGTVAPEPTPSAEVEPTSTSSYTQQQLTSAFVNVLEQGEDLAGEALQMQNEFVLALVEKLLRLGQLKKMPRSLAAIGAAFSTGVSVGMELQRIVGCKHGDCSCLQHQRVNCPRCQA